MTSDGMLRLARQDYNLKAISLGMALLFSSCFSSRGDIFQQPYSQWSSRDCLTVIASAMSHNLASTEDEIAIIATPYYPHVLAAINRLQELQFKWDSSEARSRMDILLESSAGLYVDWESNKELVTSRGSYVRSPSDIDSLLILVTVINKAYPVNIPFIKDLDHGIYILNDGGDSLEPRFVWGKARSRLLREEKYFARFVFTNEEGIRFLKGTNNIYLVVTSFGRAIRLTLPVKLPRFSF